jgi:hypothetical protein
MRGMAEQSVRVVLHARRNFNREVYADDSFVWALRAQGIQVVVEVPKPESEPTTPSNGDSAFESLVEHIHVYLNIAGPGLGTWVSGQVGDEEWNLLKDKVKRIFVQSAAKRIKTQRAFRHERTVTIYDANGKPHIEVTVAGHADEETTVVDRAFDIDTRT